MYKYRRYFCNIPPFTNIVKYFFYDTICIEELSMPNFNLFYTTNVINNYFENFINFLNILQCKKITDIGASTLLRGK